MLTRNPTLAQLVGTRATPTGVSLIEATHDAQTGLHVVWQRNETAATRARVTVGRNVPVTVVSFVDGTGLPVVLINGAPNAALSGVEFAVSLAAVA